MTAEATLKHGDPHQFHRSSAHAALTAGQVIILPDGRVGVVPGANNAAGSVASGTPVEYQVVGVYEFTKAASVVIPDGQEVWWDHSANEVVLRPANDKDVRLGTSRGDSSSAATTIQVEINVFPQYIINLQDSGFDHVPVLTAGTPSLAMVGGTARAAFSATAEAQKLDLLSKRSFPIGSDWIFEAEVEVSTNGDADVVDLSVGVADDTHASDADTIAEFCGIHLDPGADLDIMAESDDGTTEVAATDTTVNWAVGTPFHILIDGRDPSDCQIYIDGVLVLSGTTFDLSAGTGPLKALFHLEKSANDSPCVVDLHMMRVRLTDVPS